jgi:guanylate cyclase soluble subunit alpha
VGVKMPRYCMFGHNVTVANKFESGSEPLRINISPTTYAWVSVRGSGPAETDTFRRLVAAGGFSFEARDRSCLPKDFPRNIPGTCHFLTGYKHPDLDDDASLTQHIESGLKDIGLSSDVS